MNDKKWKRILAFMLAFVLMFGMLPQGTVSVLAETEEAAEESEAEEQSEEAAEESEAEEQSEEAAEESEAEEQLEEAAEESEAEEQSENVAWDDEFEIVLNPLYQDVMDADEAKAELLELQTQPQQSEEGISTFGRETYCTSLDEAAEYVKDQMVARKNEITFLLDSDVYGPGAAGNIFDKAMEHTESCAGWEGDALAWGWKGASYGSSYYSSDYREMTYYVSYYTTANQEMSLTYAVDIAIKSLKLDGMSEYGKVKKIYDYICDTVDYDYTGTDDLKYTAYAALCNKKAVCQGYAVLFYRLCKEAGLSVRVITGTSYGENHAWNIVKINGKYYNIDSTWDGQDEITYHDYFLKNQSDFYDHVRSSEYLTTSFMATYPMSETSWDEDSAVIYVTSITLNQTSKYLVIGDTLQLTATVSPTDAANQAVTYTSSNEKAATVDSSGKVMAVAEGQAVITAAAQDGSGTKATCTITVTKYDMYTGLRSENGQWVYYTNGKKNTSKTGLVKYNGAWFYVKNGVVDTSATGFIPYDGGLFYVAKGRVVSSANGLVADGSVWYFVSGGQVQTQYSDLAEYDGAWFVLENGKLNQDYNGLYTYDGREFLVAAGQLKSEYSGLFQYEKDGKWYFIAEGQVSNYSGLVLYDGAWFYIKNGVLAEDYTGRVKYNGSSFYVVNGMVKN